MPSSSERAPSGCRPARWPWVDGLFWSLSSSTTMASMPEALVWNLISSIACWLVGSATARNKRFPRRNRGEDPVLGEQLVIDQPHGLEVEGTRRRGRTGYAKSCSEAATAMSRALAAPLVTRPSSRCLSSCPLGGRRAGQCLQHGRFLDDAVLHEALRGDPPDAPSAGPRCAKEAVIVHARICGKRLTVLDLLVYRSRRSTQLSNICPILAQHGPGPA